MKNNSNAVWIERVEDGFLFATELLRRLGLETQVDTNDLARAVQAIHDEAGMYVVREDRSEG